MLFDLCTHHNCHPLLKISVREITKCPQCNEWDECSVDYNILNISLKDNDNKRLTTLQEAIADYCRRARLPREKPHECGAKVVEKEDQITEASDLFIIQVKRFNGLQKDCSSIDVPFKLTLAGKEFNLKAFIIHCGQTMQSGHSENLQYGVVLSNFNSYL